MNLSAILAVSALASLAGYVLAGLSLRAVESMRGQAAAISSETPGERLPVPRTGDEVERLGETLNEMLARLERGLERERAFVAGKDMAGRQCDQMAERVVQVDRRSGEIRDEARVQAKFGVGPAFIPDYLALVGDASDGYPGLPGIGPKTAARLIQQHGHLEQFPQSVLGENRERALFFKNLATLRTDAALFDDVDRLRWSGPTDGFKAVAEKIGNPRLAERALRSAYTRAL